MRYCSLRWDLFDEVRSDFENLDNLDNAQHEPCTSLQRVDLVVLEDGQQLRNWIYGSFANWKANYANLVNDPIIETVVYPIKQIH